LADFNFPQIIAVDLDARIEIIRHWWGGARRRYTARPGTRDKVRKVGGDLRNVVIDKVENGILDEALGAGTSIFTVSNEHRVAAI
jgi:hypothetical protein